MPEPDPRTRYDLAESTVQALGAAALLALAGDLGDLTLDYAPPAGHPGLRAAIGAGAGVPADQVLTVPGTMLGLLLLAGTLCRDGGEVVLVTPCFGPADGTLARAGATVRRVALDFAEAYAVDVARIAAACGPATRLVCLANPQNPSGRVVPEPTLLALLRAIGAVAPDALICLDETYREATHGDAPTPPSAAALDPRVVTLGSLSKAHGAPGLRIGWLTVPDAALYARLVAAKLELLICGSVLDEALAAALLARPDGVLAPRRRALAAAFAEVAAWHAAREAVRLDLLRPDAGALCCLRLAPWLDAGRFWDAVPEAGFRLAPGRWFGESDRVFRLGFGHLPPFALRRALEALSGALDRAGAHAAHRHGGAVAVAAR